VAILQEFIRLEPGKRILVTAPTHNAVDNVMRTFLSINKSITALRVSTDVSFFLVVVVLKQVQHFR
jgi:regulator of nonsense transcripts 1